MLYIHFTLELAHNSIIFIEFANDINKMNYKVYFPLISSSICNVLALNENMYTPISPIVRPSIPTLVRKIDCIFKKK